MPANFNSEVQHVAWDITKEDGTKVFVGDWIANGVRLNSVLNPTTILVDFHNQNEREHFGRGLMPTEQFNLTIKSVFGQMEQGRTPKV